MVATPHTAVRPQRITLRSETLQTEVRSVVGYCGTCTCGWVGPRRDTYLVGRRDAWLHDYYEHRADDAS